VALYHQPRCRWHLSAGRNSSTGRRNSGVHETGLRFTHRARIVGANCRIALRRADTGGTAAALAGFRPSAFFWK
jgi:hypothetical protein